MQGGYIKDYRRELESAIWAMPPLYHRVWQWLKYSVNHKAQMVPFKDGSTVKVDPGERITSYRNIAQGVGWYERGIWRQPNPKTIKNILEWMEGEQMIAVESNTQYTLVKVCNWGIYQARDTDESNTQETAGKQCADTNKNDKNDKNDKKSYIYSPVALEILEYWNQQQVVIHRETDSMMKEIAKGLKKHKPEIIRIAIDRYLMVLNDPSFYYKHKWTLPKFLNQKNGVPEFLDEGQVWNNYCSKDNKPIKPHAATVESDIDRMLKEAGVYRA